MRLGVREGLSEDQLRQVANDVLEQQVNPSDRLAMQNAINRGLAEGAADKGLGLSGALNLISKVNGGTGTGQGTGQDTGQQSGEEDLAGTLTDQMKKLIADGQSPEEAMSALTQAIGSVLNEAEGAALLMEVGRARRGFA